MEAGVKTVLNLEYVRVRLVANGRNQLGFLGIFLFEVGFHGIDFLEGFIVCFFHWVSPQPFVFFFFFSKKGTSKSLPSTTNKENLHQTLLCETRTWDLSRSE